MATTSSPGLQVNAKVVANKEPKHANDTLRSPSGVIKTFLGEVTIRRWKFFIRITPRTLTLQVTIQWNNVLIFVLFVGPKAYSSGLPAQRHNA